MITLLGSLFGFLASFAPEVLKLIQNKRDLKHELDVLDRQLEAKKFDASARLNEITVQGESEQLRAAYSYADEPVDIKWIEALIRSVRPIITYGFFILFVVVKVAILDKALSSGIDLTSAVPLLWDEETAGLFSVVMGFWFGSRVRKSNDPERYHL